MSGGSDERKQRYVRKKRGAGESRGSLIGGVGTSWEGGMWKRDPIFKSCQGGKGVPGVSVVQSHEGEIVETKLEVKKNLACSLLGRKKKSANDGRWRERSAVT